MIVDTSAIVAILLDEPGAEALSSALLSAIEPTMSAATLVELYAVVDRRSTPQQRRRLDRLLDAYGIAVVPFTPAQAVIARDAYRDFGRGSGHAARLNLGDCFAYALATDAAKPLLFVGDDFRHTDIEPALAP
ncbi:type II toxin-antitoxin system VapC family toxin [Mumia sp. Pv 4-285]|uniref:type II toxin-antitoxin system VapC family toxin n=1 Tax=Mumia qirimensis TaxID=3234852 RepID=UPI00351CE78A